MYNKSIVAVAIYNLLVTSATGFDTGDQGVEAEVRRCLGNIKLRASSLGILLWAPDETRCCE